MVDFKPSSLNIWLSLKWSKNALIYFLLFQVKFECSKSLALKRRINLGLTQSTTHFDVSATGILCQLLSLLLSIRPCIFHVFWVLDSGFPVNFYTKLLQPNEADFLTRPELFERRECRELRKRLQLKTEQFEIGVTPLWSVICFKAQNFNSSCQFDHIV